MTNDGDPRKERILKAAVYLSTEHGYCNITRDSVAGVAGVAPGLVNYYFGDMRVLIKEVMYEAIRTKNYRVIVQGLALKNPHALKCPIELRAMAASILV